MDLFERNIKALINKEEGVLAARLMGAGNNERYEVFVDAKDALNINLYDKKVQEPFYQEVPIQEVQRQFEWFMQVYGRHPYLYLFGIANGLLVKMLLESGKTLFVFEPQMELLRIALHLMDFSKEIEEERLVLIPYEEASYLLAEKIIEHPDRKVFAKTYRLEATHEYYLRFFAQEMQTLNRYFVEAIRIVVTKNGNDVNDSLIGLDHQLKHIPAMIASYPLKETCKAINSPYAIIVSTGPSLNKQLPLLKAYAPYVTILCIDASLPILQREKIAPDFVFSLERVEETSKFFEDLDRDLLRETIFMPTSITHPKTLEHLQGMRLAISMRPFGYNSAFGMHKWGYIGRGMSAANMAFDFAQLAGFDNIVLIGQDLAFGEGMVTHAKGALYGEKEENYLKRRLSIKGYYGDRVETTPIWQLFLNTFVRDIEEAKSYGIKVYNCTEGGAYIKGAEHIPFEEFLQTIDKKPKSKINLSSIAPKSQMHYRKRAKRLIEIYEKHLSSAKEQIEEVFLAVMDEIETLERLNAKNELEKIDYNSLAEVISKIDQAKDLFENDRALKKFTNITLPYILNAELELGVIMTRPSRGEIEKKAKMIDWIYAHKSWLFFLAGAIENILYLLRTNYKEVYRSIE